MIPTFKQDRMWNNFIGNSDFALIIDNRGIGYNHISKPVNASGNIKSEIINLKPKVVLIKDINSGDIWSSAYRVETENDHQAQFMHGSGYTILNSEYNDIQTQTKYFVPQNEHLEIWHLKISNTGLKKRELSLATFENENNDFFKGFTNADSKCDGLRCLGFFCGDTIAGKSDIRKFINPKFNRKKSPESDLECGSKFNIFQVDIELEPTKVLDFVVIMAPEYRENVKPEIFNKFGNIEAVENEYNKILNNKICTTNAIRIF